MNGTFRIVEHPADLGIEAEGSTLRDAFAAAAYGLVSIILDPAAVETRESRDVSLDASDREQLLVKWLSEILYLYDGQGFVAKEFEIDRLTPTLLNARVQGEMFDLHKHHTKLDVKAVTYHQLEIAETNNGVRVRVFLDI